MESTRDDNSVGKYDRYLVKIHGKGRLTVRNRHLIRKYTLCSPYVGSEHEATRYKKVTDPTTAGENIQTISEQRIFHNPQIAHGSGDHTPGL